MSQWFTLSKLTFPPTNSPPPFFPSLSLFSPTSTWFLLIVHPHVVMALQLQAITTITTTTLIKLLPHLCTSVIVRSWGCQRKKAVPQQLLLLSSRILLLLLPLRESVLLLESVLGWSKSKGLVSTSWGAVS